jgi:hypothetical protein
MNTVICIKCERCNLTHQTLPPCGSMDMMVGWAMDF